MTLKSRLIFIIIILNLAFMSILLSLSKGSTSIPFEQLLFAENRIFFELRLPRTLTAFISGGLLALAGSLMQLLLQNPLADPYVLGVSGGAAVITLIMMLFGFTEYWFVGGAWAGSLGTILLILLLARKHRWQTSSLLLSGIAIACGLSACISFILLISPDANLHSMLFWLSGDLNDAQFPWLGLMVLLLGMFLCFWLAPGLNLLCRGEREAQSLGLSTKNYRVVLYFLSSLLTATAVTMSGCIGFIGLIIPHLTRRLIGYDHRFLLPTSALLGGTLLTTADVFSRTWFAPQQIPVGILIAMIGVPVFIWLLQK
jgi:iron complex transport system permease protein